MVIDPKVGDKVRVLDQECCDGNPTDSIGEIVKIEDDLHIQVRPIDDVTDENAFWHCNLCLEPA